MFNWYRLQLKQFCPCLVLSSCVHQLSGSGRAARDSRRYSRAARHAADALRLFCFFFVFVQRTASLVLMTERFVIICEPFFKDMYCYLNESYRFRWIFLFLRSQPYYLRGSVFMFAEKCKKSNPIETYLTYVSSRKLKTCFIQYYNQCLGKM